MRFQQRLRNKFFLLLISIFLGVCFASSLYAQSPVSMLQDQQESPIEATADSLEYVKGEKKIVAKGNVVVIYQATKLTSDYAEVFTDTKKAYAEGHVTIYRGDGMLRGEKVFYNFKTHQGSFPNGTAIQYPWYGHAEQMDQVSKNKVQLYNASLTTCPLDAGDPHYAVTAKRAIVYPGDRFIAYDVKFKILGKTVFWLPYLNIPLDVPDPPLVLQPGHSKQWGWYVLASKTFSVTDNVDVRFHADWYEKRSFGGGIDSFYGFESLRTGGYVKLYGINDNWAPINRTPDAAGEINPYSERGRKRRYRLTWKHRTDFDDYSNLIMQFYKLSDSFFLQDFFESEYRADVQPATYGVITRNTNRSGLFVNADVRTNKFFSTTEELPQLRFDWNNQRIGRSKIFYKNQIGAANFRQKFGERDEKNESWRFDMLHELSLPHKIANIQILPNVGIRNTYYSDSVSGDSEYRLNVEAGIDIKTQYAKVYDWSGKILGMEFNKIRHLVEPSIGFHDTESFGPKRVKDLFQFDPIDRLGTRREMVLGLENRIQTKREYQGQMRRVDVVSLNTFLFFNAKTDRPNIEEMVGFTDMQLEATFRPYDWLIFDIETLFDLKTFDPSIVNFDLILSYKDYFSILLGYRYLRNQNLIEGSNQLVLDGNLKINSRWQIGGYIRAEMASGNLEEWELRMTRNLSCGWFLDLGFNVRNSDIDSRNISFYGRLTLVPVAASYGTGSRATFANPRIGDRIAGGESSNFTRDILGQIWHRKYQPNYRY